MSHSSSPNNRNSIFGWVKNIKKPNFLSSDSVNHISDSDNASSDEKDVTSSSISPTEFLRPILHHKSRSANNVNRVRSNSHSDKSIRQHRDSFMMNNPLVDENSKYFGVPLDDAIDQACAKISIFTNEDHSLQYGKIPIVVAKCGVFLKSNGLAVEGIFRVGGSAKRLKDLQVIFNSPPDFGKKLSWDGYTVHDAASILRRYLNALPEPLIPLDLYESFRDPLRNRLRIINYMKYKANNPKKSPPEISPAVSPVPEAEVPPAALATPATPISPDLAPQELPSPQVSPAKPVLQVSETDSQKKRAKKSKNYKKLTNDVHEAIAEYKKMVDLLPNLSKQLLFYILDLLAMVQNHSGENLMSSRNLAAIFQPSILSHPSHDLNPTEYALSQFVVEFLIQYAYKLLPHQDGAESKANSTSNSSVNLRGDELLSTTFKRQHSKSLSSSANHEDLVGYENNVNSKSLPIVDTDHEFEITDDEQSASNSNSFDESNEASANVPNDTPANVSIIVSTPSAPAVPRPT